MKELQKNGQDWLEKLVTLLGCPTPVTLTEPEADGVCWLTIEDEQLTPEQIETLIGERGKTIDAIQYLLNTTQNLGREREQQQPFTVEIANYRVKRQAELLALVEDVVQQVRRSGEEVEMSSLSAAERRQVHHLLKDATDLITESRGSEPHRHLYIRLRD
ncbi:RNA-binding protein [Spirulina sp. CS-785/01]|uniref:Jag family protein n=1 Tax=Spirulina sp. CS-785/01 TaxID=3021716 RepID=UPI00232E4A8C|nr:R3H domain-containing nucleic acid-binding protein [Spirulina sp. CS-785/01]MDB9313451.1 RNA-binding protein [Spirulina sp. CS-785/01]